MTSSASLRWCSVLCWLDEVERGRCTNSTSLPCRNLSILLCSSGTMFKHLMCKSARKISSYSNWTIVWVLICPFLKSSFVLVSLFSPVSSFPFVIPCRSSSEIWVLLLGPGTGIFWRVGFGVGFLWNPTRKLVLYFKFRQIIKYTALIKTRYQAKIYDKLSN